MIHAVLTLVKISEFATELVLQIDIPVTVPVHLTTERTVNIVSLISEMSFVYNEDCHMCMVKEGGDFPYSEHVIVGFTTVYIKPIESHIKPTLI